MHHAIHSSGHALGTVSIGDAVSCRVCGRDLLAGERTTGMFEPSGHGPYDVCDLCLPHAGSYGLVPEPLPHAEDGPGVRRASLRGMLRRLVRRRRTTPEGALPVGSAAVPMALRALARTSHGRTLASLRRSLGEPEVSVRPRSGTASEILVTVCWDVGWYQYRVSPSGVLWRNGTRSADIAGDIQDPNAHLLDDGSIRLLGSLASAVEQPAPGRQP